MPNDAQDTPVDCVDEPVRLTAGSAVLRLNSSRRIRCTWGAAMVTSGSRYCMVLLEGQSYQGTRVQFVRASPLYGGCTLVLERK